MAKWKPVVGYETRYEVSDAGGVRSTVAVRHGPCNLKIVHRKYSEVCLMQDGKRSMQLVHRLVLFAFVGPPPAGTECCHFNGNTADNTLSNLRWGTREDNVADIVRLGRHAFGQRNGKHTKPWATHVQKRKANGTFAGVM